MSELRLLAPDEAAAALREASDGARGFLGLDPVTQNDALLSRELTRLGAQVFHGGGTVLGYRSNPDQPRQAIVASTAAEPEPLRAFLGFLGTFQRCTSFTALIPAAGAATAAFEGCGFHQVGTLPDHRYQSGRYQDVLVYFARSEDVCPS